jgi:hypothetical protein
MNPKLQEAMGDPEFARLLEESEPYYEEAASFYRWEPPNGETICMLTGVKAGKVMDSWLKKEVLQVRATVEIQRGELEGKTFDLSGTFGWTPRNFVGLKTLASIMADEPIGKMVEGLDVLYDNIGTLIRVSTTRTPRQDGGDPWVNHRVLEVIDSGPTEGTVAEDAITQDN